MVDGPSGADDHAAFTNGGSLDGATVDSYDVDFDVADSGGAGLCGYTRPSDADCGPSGADDHAAFTNGGSLDGAAVDYSYARDFDVEAPGIAVNRGFIRR